MGLVTHHSCNLLKEKRRVVEEKRREESGHIHGFIVHGSPTLLSKVFVLRYI
jgi:hypothetical protein